MSSSTVHTMLYRRAELGVEPPMPRRIASCRHLLEIVGFTANSVTPHSNCRPGRAVMTCTTRPANVRPEAPCSWHRELRSSYAGFNQLACASRFFDIGKHHEGFPSGGSCGCDAPASRSGRPASIRHSVSDRRIDGVEPRVGSAPTAVRAASKGRRQGLTPAGLWPAWRHKRRSRRRFGVATARATASDRRRETNAKEVADADPRR